MSLTRLALQDITLSDGFFILKGTYTAFSSLGISRNPSLYSNPETFDGFRFSKLREQPGNENRYQERMLYLLDMGSIRVRDVS